MKNVSLNTNMVNGVYDNQYDGYPEFRQSIIGNFEDKASTYPIFTTDVQDVFDIFLAYLPVEARQHYTCNSCRSFFNRYGGLVTVNEKGNIQSAVWDEKTTPTFFKAAAKAMKQAVNKARITGVFLTSDRTLGTPITGEWDHFCLSMPSNAIYRNRLLTSGQAMAEKREDYRMLSRSIAEFNMDTINQALTLLETESLYRSEKVLGVAKWFKEVHEARNAVRNTRNKENLTWLAVATAPTGYTHVRSSMIGTLLEDIASGMSFNLVSRRFKDKMDPLQYQRPQAAPSAGNIAQAEKIVEKLGIQNSLERRFARIDELELAWKPKEFRNPAVSTGGVFSHLQPKQAVQQPKANMNVPTVTMTWDKFQRTVLPNAEQIEMYVGAKQDNYCALVTAVHEDAPPIIQWDSEEQRNPFSWYLYNGGSYPSSWNLATGYVKVTGITYKPSMWYNENAHQGKGIIMILDGAKDTRYTSAGNALFPEILKSDLRQIRSTIEAYSRGATIQGEDDASACGLSLQSGGNWNVTLRVTTSTGVVAYKLDRWD
jgi:hypothetical protein